MNWHSIENRPARIGQHFLDYRPSLVLHVYTKYLSITGAFSSGYHYSRTSAEVLLSIKAGNCITAVSSLSVAAEPCPGVTL